MMASDRKNRYLAGNYFGAGISVCRIPVGTAFTRDDGKLAGNARFAR
jgi:hypothetical protein